MKDTQDMPDALRILANEIDAPDYIPAMCLRDAAEMIEDLLAQRDSDRREAEEFRDNVRVNLERGHGAFSWEIAEV